MANPEPKSGSSSTSTLRDTSKLGEKLVREASPRVQERIDETIEQVTDVASDLYQRANRWLDQGNNRVIAMAAAAATAGVIGFVIGRNLRSSGSEL